jgi:hypothetical protein
MGERLAHLIRNQEQEIWISLQDVRGEQQIELQLYERDASAIAELAPGKERICIPVDLLPVLVKALSRAQEVLMNRGLLYIPPTPQVTQLERGNSVGFGAEERPKSQAARQHPRVPLNIRGECRLLDKKDFWPGKPVAGEVLNVSAGGAQVRLPQRFSRFGQVELFMVVDGMVFRARAEVAGADAIEQKDATAGQFRHSLRWLSLEGPARDVLAKIIASRAPDRPSPTE